MANDDKKIAALVKKLTSQPKPKTEFGKTYDKTAPARVVDDHELDREKFFKEYAEGRAAELRLNGVYVFASRKPATLYVHVSDPKDFPPGFATRLKSALLDSFKASKYDEGLTKVLDMTLEAKGSGDKK